jgi:diguanylate cyclase (GGDEF)-like protein
MQLNWPSLLAFVVFVATLGIVSSLTNRRQIEQIERQRNKMLQDEERLRELSVRDSLTGLYNRRYMDETLRREIELALRTGSRLGLVMIDVDEFKSVNDTFGHALGDLVLCEIAARLRENTRRTDIACRFGGDEFVLILPDCSLNGCIMRAEAICTAVGNTAFICEGVCIGNVGLSIGAAALPEDGWTAEDIMKAADGAMYTAKSEGKNRVCSASALGTLT